LQGTTSKGAISQGDMPHGGRKGAPLLYYKRNGGPTTDMMDERGEVIFNG
jgi:hypothetical protein